MAPIILDLDGGVLDRFTVLEVCDEPLSGPNRSGRPGLLVGIGAERSRSDVQAVEENTAVSMRALLTLLNIVRMSEPTALVEVAEPLEAIELEPLPLKNMKYPITKTRVTPRIESNTLFFLSDSIYQMLVSGIGVHGHIEVKYIR